MSSSADYIIKQTTPSKRLKYLFYLFQFVFGLDFGYVRCLTPRIRIVLTFFFILNISVGVLNVVLYTSLIDDNLYILLWMLSMLLQHTFNSTVLRFIDKGSFYNLQKSLSSLDLKLMSNVKAESRILMFCIGSIAYRSIIISFYCSQYKGECILTPLSAAITSIQEIANDITLIIGFFIFHTVQIRLQTLVKIIQNNEIPVLESLNVYKSIVDAVDKIKKPFDMLFVIALVVTAPNLIVTSYMGLHKLKSHSDGNTYSDKYNIVRTAFCAQDCGLLFAPAISAGLLSSEVDRLKVILYDRLLHERHEDHAATIEVFISYVEARSLNLSVLRLIRLDWSLPVLIVNLCISYQIVIVQLTHLY